MAKVEATYWYQQGLENIAEKGGVSIPEAAVIASADLLEQDKPERIPDVIIAAESFNPGINYTVGLSRIAGITRILREVTRGIIADLRRGSAYEHIEPTERAFTWHTGEQL